MTLSENYIQRLKNLAGIDLLNEADNRETIVKKIGLPQAIADWAHELSDKYSIWIANTFKDRYFSQSNYTSILSRMQPEVKEAVLKMMATGKYPPAILKNMKLSANDFEPQYTYILGWLRGRNTPPVRETDQIDFRTLTFDEALARSQAWHREIEKLQGGSIKDEDGKVVLHFPDGFYWINLGKSRCEKEAQAMGHCGSGRGILYSLRRDKHPYITVDLVNGVIGQIKARANTKPKPEFFPYIIAFLLNKDLGVTHLKSSYKPETDFQLTDLPDAQLNELIRKKPSLLEGDERAARRLTPETIDFVLRNAPAVFRTMNVNGLFSPEQNDYILNNMPSLFLDEKNIKSMLGFTKPQLMWVVKNTPEFFATLLKHNYDWTKDDMDNSHIDSEVISALLERIDQSANFGGKICARLGMFPISAIRYEHLDYILKKFPGFFRAYDLLFLNKNDAVYTHLKADIPKLVEHILTNHLDWLKYHQNTGASVNISYWPFTEQQKQLLIEKQESGEIDSLEQSDLSHMNFSKKQIAKMVKDMPQLFDPKIQHLDELGITAKGIEHIITSSPDTIPEKMVEQLLKPEEIKSFFKRNPNWTNAVYLILKYRGYDGVKSLKESVNGGFKPEFVEILYNEWSDEDLGNLFDKPDVIKQIANYELDFHGYDYKFDDIDSNFDDLTGENLAYVSYLLKKAFTSQQGMYDADKTKIKHTIMAMNAGQLASIISEPDNFKEENGIEEYDEHIIEELKNAFVRAVEDAQGSADESEYWKLFTKPVQEFFGEAPQWIKKMVKTYKAGEGEKVEEKDFLKFKMDYTKFIGLLKDYEEYNSSDDEYSIRITDGLVNPADIIAGALKENGQELELKEPYNGVYGHLSKEDLNDRFSDHMHDNLSKELANAKVVKKKKSK